MVIEKRKGIPTSKEEGSRIKAAHRKWVQEIQKRMSLFLKEGRTVTIKALVPIGHNVYHQRRVGFKKRKNLVTGKPEGFLPRDRLEEVALTHFVLIEPSEGRTSIKDRTYYLVRPELVALTRVVWGRYCSLDLEVKELLQLPSSL